MTDEEAKLLIPACGRIVIGDGWGTGYLITHSLVATCDHVVGNLSTGTIVTLEFNGSPTTATIREKDEDSDCAILELESPLERVAPLPIAETCQSGAKWVSYGFPITMKGVGFPFFGDLELADGEDDQRKRVLILFSPKAAAGMGAPINGFSGSPVLAGGAVIGHLKRVIPDWGTGSTNPLKQAYPHTAYGSIFATPSRAVLRLARMSPTIQSVSFQDGPRTLDRPKIFTIWKKWFESDQPKGVATLSAVKELINAGRPAQALDLLQYAPPGLETEQKRALAMAKLGRVSESISILTRLRDAGHRDGETLGLLAGRFKQQWQDSDYSDTSLLKSAFQVYSEAFLRTEDTYPGVNAASLALLLGDHTQSKELAEKVMRLILEMPEDKRDHWHFATLGEAYLLLDRLAEAKEWYGKAVAHNPMAQENIAVMRRQARLDLKGLGKCEGELDSVLAVPRVVAFSGHMTDTPNREVKRFPEPLIPRVREELRRRLRVLNVGYGFSSAARGSDLLFVEELLARRGHAHVFLPFPAPNFAKTSVGFGWDATFQGVLEKGDIDLTILSQQPPADQKREEQAYEQCNYSIQQAALEKARLLDEKPILLTVWNGNPGDGVGGTADAVRAWRRQGIEPELIDLSQFQDRS